MTGLVDLADEAAGIAADFLLHRRPGELQVESKSSATDAVTEMDRRSESLIVEHLLNRRGDDGVLGEEGGERRGSSGVRWVIDPLDGTVNYLYGLPMWAVSVAAELDGEVVAGVVRAPMLGVSWLAERGAGSWRRSVSGDLQRNAVTTTTDLAQALVATGFGYAAADRVRQAERLLRVIGSVRDIRRAGAAAIDLCWVADSTVDAYFEEGTHHWDRAAAGLIATEAGAVVCDAAGGPPTDDMTVATSAALAPALRALLGTT